MTPLVARDVRRAYAGRAVVDGASLSLEPGKVTALLGGSGAGKSTLLRLFAGLEPVDDGEIALADEVLSRPGATVPTENRRVGLIFQDFALFPHLSALENVCFGLAHLDKAARRDTAMTWLERLGLAGRAEAYPNQLSGGEQQRVAIARALAPEPVAILMDEPFSGLDPALRASVRDVALEAVRASGAPALLVTHDAGEAMQAADTLAVMRAARIVQTGAPEEVYSAPVDLETARALGPVNVLPVLSAERARLTTPFGEISASGATESSIVAVREEDLAVDPDGAPNAEVVSVVRTGPLARVVVARDGASFAALVSPEARPKVGDAIRVSFEEAQAFIFGAGGA